GGGRGAAAGPRSGACRACGKGDVDQVAEQGGAGQDSHDHRGIGLAVADESQAADSGGEVAGRSAAEVTITSRCRMMTARVSTLTPATSRKAPEHAVYGDGGRCGIALLAPAPPPPPVPRPWIYSF